MKKIILVLDDDEVARRALGAIFESAGHEVILISNVPEAINVVREGHIDLAVVDIKMPVFDGYKFCEFLRKTKTHSKIPIVILTGEKERYGKTDAWILKVEAFLEKPFDPRGLVIKVNKLLSAADKKETAE